MERGKKTGRWIAIVIAAAVALTAGVGGAALFVRWRAGGVPGTVSEWDVPFDPARERMDVRLENFSADDVTGMQKMTAVNRTGEDLEEIVLRVYANGPELLGTGLRAVDVTGVYVGDEAAEYAFDAEDPTVLRIARPWAAGEEIELRWHIRAPLTGDVTLLSLPVLGVFENGAWRTDAWDPLVEGSWAQAFDAEIWMEHGGDIGVLFGAAVLGADDNESGCIVHARMPGARDVTLLVRRKGALRSREIAGVRVSAAADGVFAAERLLDQCEAALSSLEAAGFAYPFKALTVAQMDGATADGTFASAMVFLPAEKDGEAQLQRLTRLIARQTFGVLVGSDPWQEPWLSAALASTAELMAYRARRGAAAFEERFFSQIEVATRLTRPYGVTVGAGIDRFGGESEMAQVLRDQGAAMMLGLETAMGGEAFFSALGAYVRDHAHGVATRASLEAALREASGSDWSGYLEDELNY